MKKSVLFLASVLCGASVYAAMPPVKSVEATSVSHHLVSTSTMLAPKAGDVVVLKSQQIGENAAIQVVKDSRGIVSKRIVKGSAAVRKANAALKSTEGISLQESFEGWDGSTKDWLPAGWSEINSSAELAALEGGAFTWQTSTNSSGLLLNAIDGNNYAIIYFASSTNEQGESVELAQDEWLLSPVFTPTAGETLSFSVGYAPIFLFDLRNENIDWGTMSFINKLKSTTLQILIREGDGEWTLLKDLYDDWKDTDLMTLFDKYFSNEWYNYSFSMADYAGKKIQVAFRFVGQYGNTMQLDAIQSALQKTSASYTIPEGACYWGLTDEYNLFDNSDSAKPIVQVGAYAMTLWEGIASKNAESFAWNWTDAEGVETKGDKINFGTMYYPTENNEFASAPTFTTSAPGALSDSFTLDALISAGGKPSNGTELFPLTNANIVNNGFTFISYGGVPVFGYNSNSDATWTKIYFGSSATPTETQKAHVSGLAAFYDHTIFDVASYLNQVSVQGIGTLASTDKLAIDIYSIDKDGEIKSVVATGKFSKNESFTAGSYVYNTLLFDITDKEGNPFVFDQPIYVVFTGFDVEGNDFTVLQDVDYEGPSTGCFLVDYTSGGSTTKYISPINIFKSSKGEMNGNFLINLYTEQPWLSIVGDSEVELAGSNKTASFLFDSYYSHDKFDFSFKNADYSTADWIHYTIGETETNDFSLNVTVDDLPDGVQWRVAYITVDDGLWIANAQITQSKTSGVEEITIASPVKFIDGNIIVEGAQSDINVYNLAGAVVATASAQEGSTIIDASSLGSGIYLVRIADKAYKIRK